MNKLFKTFFVTILLMLFPVIVNAECTILIDGTPLLCRDASGNEVSPYIYEGTTYVPLRAIGEAFDLTISWEQATKTVHIGAVGGSPQLSEYINIYKDGEEVICHDAAGNVVFPQLNNSTTFLPIRAIGELFGKTIAWDNSSKTAIITTPPSLDSKDYFVDALENTEAFENLSVLFNLDATMSVANKTVASQSTSDTLLYSPYSFSISSLLPDDYLSSLSYLGEGNFFLCVPSDKFVAKHSLTNILNKQNSSANFSNLYMYFTMKGGYITELEIDLSSILSYNNIFFDESYTMKVSVLYPDTFTFPTLPFPEANHNSNESAVPIQTGSQSDFTALSNIIEEYVKSSLKPSSANLLSLLIKSDFDALYKGKSTAQYNSEVSTMNKKLTSRFENATGNYTTDALVYIDINPFPSAERAAKANISIEKFSDDEFSFEEIEIKFFKKDGKWYLALTSLSDLI